MWLFLARRLLLALAIVLVAMTVLFVAIHLVPGDPASIALGPRATPAMREELRTRMGLDLPIPVQLARFAGNVLRGDLGRDLWSNQSVAALV
jgi:peptide/nickel transport system permease protein